LFFVSEDQDTPYEDICQALLFDTKKTKENVSSKQDIAKTGNYLHDLDKNLQRVLDQIITQQNSYSEMNPGVDRLLMTMKFKETKKELTLKRLIPIGDVKQFKTEFIEMQKMNPMANLEFAIDAFIDFI
jgi:Chromatin associated protein KTI12